MASPPPAERKKTAGKTAQAVPLAPSVTKASANASSAKVANPTSAAHTARPARKASKRRAATPPAAQPPAPADGGAAFVEAATLLPEVRVLRQFRQVFNAVKRHFQQVEKKAGIGGAQVWALSVVASHPGIGVNQLAKAMDVHQTTASNLVKAMLTGGMVAAKRGGTDRRAVQLTILPSGEQVLLRAPGPFAGVLPEALASLDAATLERLNSDLAQLIEVLAGDQHAAGIPLAQM